MSNRPAFDPAHVLLADVGGTNVRFAVLRGGELGPIAHMAVRDHRSFADALAIFLDTQTDRAAIGRAIFAVAGVVEPDRCALTNNLWVVDSAELRARFGLREIRLINDFEAIAWALPHLTPGDLRKIGGHEQVADAPMIALGPGTGLGVAAFMSRENGVLRSEAGHSSAPSSSMREATILEMLRKKFGYISAERVLSGPGLENIYRAIAAIDSTEAPERTAAEITRAAVHERCPTSRAALDMFCGMLGEVAGNLALTFCAQGGVFIAGGIARHIPDYLARSPFRSRFDAKGRLSGYVESIPAFLIARDDPAFVGLRALAVRQAGKTRR